MWRTFLLLALVLGANAAGADALRAERLGVIFSTNDLSSMRIAHYYAARRHIPAENVIGLPVPDRSVIDRDQLNALRAAMLDKLPTRVQSLLLVWSRPYAVECMSVTTAFAVGYKSDFCEPGCARTRSNPLYDSDGWLPADTVGWLPAMLLPSADETLARAIIDRGIAADGTHPTGTVYLVSTDDAARNVRAAGYANAEAELAGRILVRELSTPVQARVRGAIAYFTGAMWVVELKKIGFRPGAVADHLTSTAGELRKGTQMSALAWLRQGATASYGTVTEPCNFPGKFPNPTVFMNHYLRGDALIAAYWKSVAMPGQGLFIGEPLARPFVGGQ